MPDTPALPPARRALSLDALRGLAILGMILSARIPHTENWLPGWMYHGQEGPNPTPEDPHPAGFTWVDLVFPAFLFAMGTAFPFALTRRLQRGVPMWRLLLGILMRFALLVAFAIYLQHTVPYVMGNSRADHWVGFLALLLLFPILTRFPSTWNRRRVGGLRLAGAAGAVILLSEITYPDGSGFRLGRSDIIIMVLANMALFGSVIWLLTRRSLPLRLATLVLGLLGHCSMNEPTHITLGLGTWLAPLNATPIAWFWKLLFLKYVFVVVPGMIVGDLLLAWMSSPSEKQVPSWSPRRVCGMTALLCFIVVFAHVSLKARWGIAAPTALVGACALIFGLMRSPATPTERLLFRLHVWATLWLIVGLAFEPFEGGIKKTSSTMSYYFVSAGLSIFLLMILQILIDLPRGKRWLALLVTNGQNPMIAYAGIRGLLGPFYRLTGIDDLITVPIFRLSAWAGAAWGLLKSLSLAWVVHLLTRSRVFWRT